MKRITNCPNCGGVLDNLKCNYCGTEIRYSNEISVFDGKPCDILLRHTQGDETILVPIRGYVGTVKITRDVNICTTCDGELSRFFGKTNVEFNFVGEISDYEP